jgi:hypothetical protein
VFIFSWLAFHRDNPKIKVSVTNGFLIPPNIEDGLKIFVNVINHGRRAVVITNTGFLLSNGSDLVTFKPIGVNFPRELAEGQKFAVIYDQEEMVKTIEEKNVTITHAWADDATGKRYRTKYKLPKNN